MIATISLYEDKQEGLTYEQINRAVSTAGDVYIPDDIWAWIQNNCVRGNEVADSNFDTRIIDGDELIKFEDLIREKYGDWIFKLDFNWQMRSQAITVKPIADRIAWLQEE